MALVNVLVYDILTGDTTYPHSGDFTIGVAGKVTIDDSDGTEDALFGDNTDTGAADVPDQNVTASTAASVNVGDTIDSRYYYEVTGSDGSSGRVYFIATNQTNNYGAHLASNFQLTPGVTYTFGAFTRVGAVNYDQLVPCFCKGTRIETNHGDVLIEQLRVGDLVKTLDDGYQPVRWIGVKSLDAIDLAYNPALLPIRIAKGALGNNLPNRALFVSPQHRVLVRSRIAQRMFDANEILISAKKLLELAGVSVAHQASNVVYYHMLFDKHQVAYSNGAATESLYTGSAAMKAVGMEAFKEITALFPEVISSDYLPQPVRLIPEKGIRIKKLVQRHEANQQPLQ